MKVHFKTLGCRLNEAELETWAQAFQKSGHQITRQVEAAQSGRAQFLRGDPGCGQKIAQLIRRIHRENPKAKLVVSGCYATLNQDEAASR